MLLNTTRFGEIEVDETRSIKFQKGLPGFSDCREFVLIQPSQDSHFFWLQSVENPDLAFIVTEPAIFAPSYRVPVKADQLQEMGLNSIDDAQVFIIVNKHGNMLTGNLQGPIVVNVANRNAMQLVLSDKQFSTRMPLMELPEQETKVQPQRIAAAV